MTTPLTTTPRTPGDVRDRFESVSDEQRRRLRDRPGESWAARAARQLKGIVTADPYPQRLTEAAAGVQAPVTTGRRIAVIGTRGGAGRTTTAALLGRVMSSLRTDPVAVVDAAGSRGTLALRLAAGQALPTAGDVLRATGPVPDTVAALTAALAPAGRNLWAASAISDADGGSALDELVVAVSRFCAVSLVDTAVLPGADTGDDALVGRRFSGFHALLHVVPCTVAGLADARWLASQAAPGLPPILTAVVDVHADAGLDVHAEARQLTHDGVPALPLGHDAHLATGVEFDLSLLARRTRLEATGLAAALIRTAVTGAAVTDGQTSERGHTDSVDPAGAMHR